MSREGNRIEFSAEELKLLEIIAAFGDFKIERLNLSPLSSSDIKRAEATMDRVFNRTETEQKQIGNCTLWTQLGRVFDELNQVGRSESCFRIAHLQDPTFAPAWYYQRLVWHL